MKWLFLLLILLPSVIAAPMPISILDIQYDNGDLSIINRSYDFGYVPDRILAPKEGYNLSIYEEDELLYSFLFNAPTKEYLDGRAGGGFFERRYFVFPLVVPSYFEETRIEIRHNDVVLDSISETYSKKTYWFLMVVLGIIILALLLLLRKNLFLKDR